VVIVTNRKMRPGAENVSSLVAYSSQANTAPTLAVALTTVSTRMAKLPSS
jgi:hypothetical protein